MSSQKFNSELTSDSTTSTDSTGSSEVSPICNLDSMDSVAGEPVHMSLQI